MKYYIYIIAIIYLGQQVCSQLDANFIDSLNKKLHELRVKQLKEVVAPNFRSKFIDFLEETHYWKFASGFSLFNQNFLMMDNDFHTFVNGKKLNITPAASIIEGHDRISIAKMIEFGNSAVMMLIVNKNQVRIIKYHKGADEQFNYQEVQAIEQVMISDAIMFRIQNKLFMVITNDKGSNIALVTLYEWTGDNFYEKRVLHTQGIPQIEVFEDNGRAILLLLRKRKGTMTICDVYEYQDQKLSKIQELKLEGPRHIIPYKVEDQNYVLVLSGWKRHLYNWTGEELIKISTESSSNNDYPKIMFTKINNSTLMFASKYHKVDIFMLSSQGAIYLSTQDYLHKFTTVLSLDHIKINETDFLFAVGNVGLIGEIEYFKIELTGFPRREEAPPIIDSLAICLSVLRDELEADDSNWLIKPHRTETRQGSEAMAALRLSPRQNDIGDLWFDEKLQEIDKKITTMTPVIEDLKLELEEMEINGEVNIEGTLKGNEITANNIELQTINLKKWVPDQWLSYSKNQTIAGGIDATNLNIIELITTGDSIDLLRDLLLNNSDNRIQGSFTIDNLNTKSMFVDEINNMKMSNVFMRGRDSMIKGIKSFVNLWTRSVEATNLQNQNSKDVLDNILRQSRSSNIRFAPHVFIEDLEVDIIDGVKWNTFIDSLFRYGISNEIEGNLKMKAFDTKHLHLSTLNGIDIKNFMTKSTDQTISSSLEFKKIHMKTNMNVNLINGLNPSERISTVHNPTVSGPISFEDLRIVGNLFLNYTIPPNEEKNIVGTKESDLLQIYRNEIKIIGNLRLKNFRNLDSLIIAVGEKQEEFNPNVLSEYWMKNVNQVIPVHVEAKNGMKTPHLQAKLLNQNEVSNYLLNNSIEALPSNFIFENVTFLGDVNLNRKKSHDPDLERIDMESVKINGSFSIQGKKRFMETLKINNLITDELNGVNGKHLATKNGPNIFTKPKIFENLVINGNLDSMMFSFDELNSVNLKNLMNNTIFIDQPQNLKTLKFTTISTDNLNVQTLNGRPIDKYLTEANDMLDSDVIDSLIINGKLAIGNLVGLSKINDKHPDVMFTNRLRLDDQGVLHGNVRFLENVTIDNLSATHINNIDFPVLVNRIFFKNGNQTIPAKYTFKNLKTRNLLAPKINDINIDPLVDIKSTKSQNIIAYKGLEFTDSSLKQVIAENISPCNVAEALNDMRSPPTQTWSSITVFGNVTIMDETNPLYDIFENAVLLNRRNVILAPVHFKNIAAYNVETNEYINQINLTHIFSDALLKKSNEQQVISGMNVISRLGVYSATVYNDSDITIVNGVDFPDIFHRVIPKKAINIMPITGKKTFFSGLQTEKIQSEKVSNVIPEQLVTIDSSQPIRSVTFENIELKNLSFNNINDQNFQHFIDERVLLKGPPIQELRGFYSFYDVHIGGNIEVPAINDVDIHDIVVDIHNQDIDSKKKFVNDIYVQGNVHIDMLNGHFISDIYQKAFLRNEISYIDQNVKIMKPSIVDGSIITEYINGYSLEKIKRILNVDMKQLQEKEVSDIVDTIQKSVTRSYDLLNRLPSEIMYLEKSNVIQLSIQNTLNAQVIRLKDYVLIHVIGEEDGDSCELPKGCKCPVQYTIQISPEYSVNTFFSKGPQRVYSYNDKMMTAHLMTNSVSTDGVCRRNSTRSERSTFAWSTVVFDNSTGGTFSETLNFTGYVSAVEFFTMNGASYAIIGKYYDPTTNSYDLNCAVYRFNEDRTTLTEIQAIETQGVWSLKVFYTQQGVYLIIGMLGDKQPTHNSEKTLFMRFNPDEQQFVLLRTVEAYGCSSALGIIVESENFIVLSHKIQPVLIFKYDLHQDNYIYYQNLWDPLPIGGISLFYSGYFGRSDPYLCVTSKRGVYSIYTYEYIEGWQQKFSTQMKGIRNLIPFGLNDKLYLLALSSNTSSVLSVVKYGSD